MINAESKGTSTESSSQNNAKDESDFLNQYNESANSKEHSLILYILFMLVYILFTYMEFPIGDLYNSYSIINQFIPSADFIPTHRSVANHLDFIIDSIFYPLNATHTCSEGMLYPSTIKLHALYNYNFFLGIKISAKFCNVEKNSGHFSSYSPYFTVLDKSPDLANLKLPLTDDHNMDFSVSNLVNTESVDLFIPHNYSYMEAAAIKNDFIKKYFVFNLKSVRIDIMLYNHNAQIASVLALDFYHIASSYMSYSTSFTYLLPGNYKSSNFRNSSFLFKAAMLALLCLYLVYRMVRIIIDVVIRVKNAIIMGKCEYPFGSISEVIMICMVFATLIFWAYIQFNMHVYNHFILPLNEADFEYYLIVSKQTRAMSKLITVCLLLIYIRLINVAYKKFPALNNLFMTFVQSRYLMLIILISSLMLLIGFSFSCGELFGGYSYTFNSLFNVFMELFKAGIGYDLYSQINKWDAEASWVFYLCYYILFGIFISKLSVSIIIGSYTTLWEKYHEDVLANAMLMQEESKAVIKKLYYLMICHNPYGRKEANCKATLKSNISKLFCESKCPYITREQINKNMQDKIKILANDRNQKILKKKKRLTEVGKKGIVALRKYVIRITSVLILRVLFVIFYIAFSVLHLEVEETYTIEESVRTYLETNTQQNGNSLGFYSINNQNQAATWMYLTLSNLLDNNFLINQHMITYSKLRGKMFFRKYDLRTNMDTETNGIIVYVKDKDDLTKESTIQNECVDNNPLTVWDSSRVPYIQYSDVNAISGGLPNSYGAFELLITDDYLLTESNLYATLFKLIADQSIGSVVFDNILYHPNSNLLVFSRTELTVNAFGIVKPDNNVASFKAEYYAGVKIGYIIIDLVVLGLFFALFVIEFNKFYRRFPKMRKDAPVSNNASDKLSESVWLQYIGLNREHLNAKSKAEKVFLLIFYSIKFFIKFVFYLIAALLSYLYKIKHILYLAHAAITSYLIAQWIKVNFVSAITSLSVDMSSKEDFAQVRDQAYNLRDIHTFTSLNLWIILIHVGFKFTFLTDLLDSAFVELIFFLLMFGTTFIYFSLTAYFVFGIQQSSFASIQQAFNSLLMILFGDIEKYSELYSSDSYVSAAFFVVFIIVMNFIMSAVLIALLRGHYEHFIQHSKYKKYNSQMKYILYSIKFYTNYKNKKAHGYPMCSIPADKKENKETQVEMAKIIRKNTGERNIENEGRLKYIAATQVPSPLVKELYPAEMHNHNQDANKVVEESKESDKSKDKNIENEQSIMKEDRELMQDIEDLKGSCDCILENPSKIIKNYEEHTLFSNETVYTYQNIDMNNEITSCYLRYTNAECRATMIKQLVSDVETPHYTENLHTLWKTFNYDQLAKDDYISNKDNCSVGFDDMLASVEYASTTAKQVTCYHLLLWALLNENHKILLWKNLSSLCKSRLWNSLPIIMEPHIKFDTIASPYESLENAKCLLEQGLKLSKVLQEHILDSQSGYEKNLIENRKVGDAIEHLVTTKCKEEDNNTRTFLWSISSQIIIESILVQNRQLHECEAMRIAIDKDRSLKENEDDCDFTLILENELGWALEKRNAYFKLYSTSQETKRNVAKNLSDMKAELASNISLINMKSKEKKEV